MKLKPRYFGYMDQTGHWREIAFNREPTVDEVQQYREVEAFYSGYAVERMVTHYKAFVDQCEVHIHQLPDWFQKFFFDMKRRIDHEHKTGDARKVSQGSTLAQDRKD